MYSNFNVTCCYCGYYFSLIPDENYPDELFDESQHYTTSCPRCTKELSIEVNAVWSYRADKLESDELNDID